VAAFIDATRASHEASIREPGSVGSTSLRSVEDPDRFVLYEWYVDEDAATAHKTTAH
jgi:autoinducer 2-degrading protein